MNCENNHISLHNHLTAMARKSGTLIGLPVVAVTGYTEQAINCNNSHMKFEDFLAASIGVDSCGKPAIRVKFIDSCETHLDCTNNQDANLMAQFFAYDSTTKTYALVLNQST